MEEEKEIKIEEEKTQNNNLFIGEVVVEALFEGVSKGVGVVGEIVADIRVVDFLKDKFNLAGEAAIEVATKLPQTVIEKIESFDGEGLSAIATSVSDTIKSIELPDIDFPEI